MSDAPAQTRPLRAWDYALALIALVITVESPFTPDDLGPSLAAGVLVAAFVLWRRSHQPARAVTRTSWRERLASIDPAAIVALLLFAWLCRSPMRWMYHSWTSGIWQNQHGLLFAVLAIALANAALRRTKGPIDASLWGLVPLGLGLTMVALDYQVKTHYLGAVGFVVSLPGLSLLLLGETRTRALAGPLALGVFLVPVPYALNKHLFLREITAAGTAWLLEGFGVQTHRDATFIAIPDATFTVADACSGFATLVAGTGIALILMTQVRSHARRLALALVVVPLVVAATIVRVTLLVLLTRLLGMDVLDTPIHPASGVAVFCVMLGTLYLVANRPPLARAFE